MPVDKNVENGKWFTVTTKQDYDNLKKWGQLGTSGWTQSFFQYGEYQGPGKYMHVFYDVSGPYGCTDDVGEVLTPKQVAELVSEKMRDLASILREARASQ